ncbi:MAG TPA: copper oxidase, partial [Sedimenticola sp.]|nr:copper oxidase [Sedimenticola sp.]
MIRTLLLAVFLLGGCALIPPDGVPGTTLQPAATGRIVRAAVAALDQPLVYNRFGSVNPYGMIYALERDLVEASSGLPVGASTCPGDVRLRPTKRPRPLVLRVNEGDVLEIRFTNRLLAEWPDRSSCRWRDLPGVDPGTRRYPPDYAYARDYGALGEPESPEVPEPVVGVAEAEGTGPDGTPVHGADWPRTRLASITVAGLTPIGGRPCEAPEDQWLPPSDPRVSGIQAIPPGTCFVYRYRAERVGTHLFFSNGAPAGGEGDGGSLVHGLFGAVHVEPEGSRWLRSQVRPEELALARTRATAPALLDYEASRRGGPVLEMLRPVEGVPKTYELVHGDLTAIVADCLGPYAGQPRCRDRKGGPKAPAFREFTVIFHDELKTFYADAFQELAREYMLEGVGDGFAINYGASGMGTLLLANRKGIGPAARCLECLYEEFFLQSWANGDPALLPGFLPDGRPAYADDPSNVYHSYLGDRVEFRNLHAGPKETHVFHLHAHQWLAQRADEPERETGTYLDSQTIAPQQGFTYPIHYGGSGNRNVTPGDSIFHCHLYPHFAQGMWALWRVHDVF